ncbi:hypothetical protein LF817_05515 [Halobacillus sp. A1]|uniref:hypothetical protein n=1 Tax=Halobacillus sp. A1 TaxID=2880262 RepID=UPI0020A66395|nr:hypothetical protein [Halobacillus sp. A1]MCP3030795.1 hypothetical protein [Halobacillus sp. A1]
MIKKDLIKNNKRLTLVISQIIMVGLIFVDLIIILRNDAIAAKLLALFSFVLIALFLAFTFKNRPTLKKNYK